MRLGIDPKLSDVKLQLQETYAPKKSVFAKWSYRFRKYPYVDIRILGQNQIIIHGGQFQAFDIEFIILTKMMRNNQK